MEEKPIVVPTWFLIALKELGVSETKGVNHSPRVLEYHDTTTLDADTDEVPWCSSFINWCIVKAGLKGTNSAAARSWLDWGRRIEKPTLGCLVVFSRGSNPKAGHVGFYVESVNHGKHLNVIGGNQNDRVQLSTYPVTSVLAYIMPKNRKKDKKMDTKTFAPAINSF